MNIPKIVSNIPPLNQSHITSKYSNYNGCDIDAHIFFHFSIKSNSWVSYGLELLIFFLLKLILLKSNNFHWSNLTFSIWQFHVWTISKSNCSVLIKYISCIIFKISNSDIIYIIHPFDISEVYSFWIKLISGWIKNKFSGLLADANKVQNHLSQKIQLNENYSRFILYFQSK